MRGAATHPANSPDRPSTEGTAGRLLPQRWGSPPLWLVLCSLPGFVGCAGGTGGGDLPLGAIRLAKSSELDADGATGPVDLRALGGFLAAGYLLDKDRSSTGAETTEHRVEERVGLGAAGSVVSPEALVYDMTGVVGFSQDWVRTGPPTDSSFDTGELYEADAEARLFSLRWYPLTLFFTRTDDFQPRVLFTRTEGHSTTAGANQQFLLERGAINLGFLHRENELTTSRDGGGSSTLADTTEDSATVHGHYDLNLRHRLRGRYVFRDVRQRPESGSFTDHRLDAEHRWLFGDGDAHELRSRLDGELRDGLFDQERIRLDERLQLSLTDRLDLRSGIILETGSREDIDKHQVRGEMDLTHELYDSLTSMVAAHGGRTVDGESTIDSFGSRGTLSYRKETALGVLRMDYTIGFERRYVEGGDGLVIDEPHTFPAVAPEEVLLLNVGVESQTIVVTDPTGTIFYRDGLDYTVTQSGTGNTFLTRVFTGLIPLGGSVLVDYRYQIGSDYTQDTVTQQARAEHRFDIGLRPYFEFRQLDQDLSDVDGAQLPVLLDERSLIGGLDWDWSHYQLGAEYEHRDSNLTPFDAVRLRAVASLPLGQRHHVSASAHQTWLFKEDPNRDLSITNANLSWRSTVSRQMEFRTQGALYYQDDSLSGVSKGASIWSELEYMWRRFSIRLRAGYRNVQDNGNEFEGLEVSVWIVREFGTLPTSTQRVVRRATQ